MRRLAVLLGLLAVLAAPAAARAAPAPFSVRLTACHHGAQAVDRYLQTTARAHLVPRAARVVLRYVTLWRPRGDAVFRPYPAPPFERAFSRAAQHVYTVGSLPPRAAYRLRVRARWVTARGRMVRVAQRVTRACRQPGRAAALP